MPETFLYFLWQYQYFSHLNLRTTDGEPVQVLYPGYRNAHAGPDFLNARLLIGGVEWVGTVEAHTRTSDWQAHRHQHDPAYDNVILHIVWEHDRPVCRADGSPMPTLALQPLTAPTLLDRYAQLHTTPDPIPCAGQLRSVQPLKLTSMLDKAMLQRLARKAEGVKAVYEASGGDWEETTYRLLATNLGMKVNAEPMEQLARAVPLKTLQKHRNALTQIEALLFGTAGLLPGSSAVSDGVAPNVVKPNLPAENVVAAGEAPTPPTHNVVRSNVVDDDYVVTLRREYRFLAQKYGLIDKQLPAHGWKWARLRPAGFPTIRLAQLAQLVATHRSLFSLLLTTDDAPQLLRALQITPTPYWQAHYRFGQRSERVAAALGAATAVNVVVNTAVPLLAAYAHHRSEPAYIDRAVALLEQLPAEQNQITRQWDALGLSVRTAFDSQASIELFNEFCTPKRCLSCQIGLALVRG